MNSSYSGLIYCIFREINFTKFFVKSISQNETGEFGLLCLMSSLLHSQKPCSRCLVMLNKESNLEFVVY